MTLLEIQNEVDKENWGVNAWYHLDEFNMLKLWPEVCRRAQLECARETLKEAAKKAKKHTSFSGNKNEIDKSSILNEDNIKLIQ